MARYFAFAVVQWHLLLLQFKAYWLPCLPLSECSSWEPVTRITLTWKLCISCNWVTRTLQKIEKEKGRCNFHVLVFSLPCKNIVRMLLVQGSSERCLFNSTVMLLLCNAMAFPSILCQCTRKKKSHKAMAADLSLALCKHTLQNSLMYKIRRTYLCSWHFPTSMMHTYRAAGASLMMVARPLLGRVLADGM